MDFVLRLQRLETGIERRLRVARLLLRLGAIEHLIEPAALGRREVCLDRAVVWLLAQKLRVQLRRQAVVSALERIVRATT